MSGVLAIASAVRMGAISAGAIVEATLAALTGDDPAIGAVTRITADRARAEAAAVDAAIAAGRDPGPLAGVPFGVEDLFDVVGLPTTAGSALYADAPSANSDAEAVQRLSAAGAVLVATLNMDEFAYGFATINACHGTTFSQNVGLIAITGVMSRHIVTLGAIFLVLSGLAPKVGALVTTIPIEVLGGGVIVMFGTAASSAVSMLSGVIWNQRNMLIFGVALLLSLGLQLEPDAVGHLPETGRLLLTSGVLPAAFVAILLNLIIPE
jgi:hypothetical protein